MTIDPILARGLRDVPPTEARVRRFVTNNAETWFKLYGYEPAQTPSIEPAALLQQIDAGQVPHERVALQPVDSGGAEEVLRDDLATPLARFVAREFRNLPLPVRLYQIGPVFRTRAADLDEASQSRELHRANATIVASNSAAADAEILALAIAVLHANGMEQPIIGLSHTDLTTGLLEAAGIAEAEMQRRVGDILTDESNQGVAAVRETLLSDTPLEEPAVDALLAIFTRASEGGGGLPEQATAIGARLTNSPGAAKARAALDRIREIDSWLADTGADRSIIRIDPFVVRRDTAFDGIVFRTAVASLPNLGSILSGGRFDILGRFEGVEGVSPDADTGPRSTSMVDLSIRIDRFADALIRLDAPVDAHLPSGRLLLLVGDEGEQRRGFRVAQQMRAAGIPVSVSLSPHEMLSHQAKRAERLRIPFLASLIPTDAGSSDDGVERLHLSSAIDPHGAMFTVQQAIEALRPHQRSGDKSNNARVIFSPTVLSDLNVLDDAPSDNDDASGSASGSSH